MGWLSGWKYRKSVTLSRASGAVSNHRMKLLVGESSGATGEDVDCEALCLSSFNDLRFTTSDGETLLPYKIESITGTTPNQLATVWIKFDSIGVGATTFYMYFGKSDASAYSNGTNTFIKYDDFEWGSNTDLVSTSGGSITWTSENGAVISTEQKYSGTRSAKLPYNSSSAKINFSLTASNDNAFRFRVYKEDASDYLFPFFHGNGSKAIYLRITDGEVLNYYDGSSYHATGKTIAADAWNVIDITDVDFAAGTFKVDVNDAGAPAACNMYATSNYNNIAQFGGDGTVSGADSWIDDIAVRDYLATDAAWGAWSALEILEILGEISESATISDSMTPLHLVDVVPESASISDEMKGSDPSGSLVESGSITALMKGSDLYGTIPETTNINDVIARNYEVVRSQAEAGNIGDVFDGTVYIYRSISESVDMVDAAERSFPQTITDLIFIWDTIVNGWGLSIDESLVLTDTLSEVLGLMISDWITLIDSQTNNWNGRDIINDTVYLYDVVDKYLAVSDTISEGITLTDANSYVLTVAVLEYLGFSSLATAMKTMADTVNEGMALADSPSYAWQEIISETLQAIDAVSVITTFIDTVSDTLTATDAASLIARVGESLNESLVFTETITNKGTLYSAVYDTLRMNVTIELSGEVYECYVLNTPKFMPSMYSGFNFNSYCVFENRAFGANDTGIYELTGTTDAGSAIHDGVILSSTDFGSRNQKRFRRAYLGISGSSSVMVVETEEGERQVYNIDTNGKAVVSRELKSKEWKLSVADFDELDTIKLIPVILSK